MRLALAALLAFWALTIWLLWPDPPAPQAAPAEPSILSVTMFIVCGESAGLLIVDSDGDAGWYPEPMEPGLRMGFLSLVKDGSLLIEITPKECKPVST